MDLLLPAPPRMNDQGENNDFGKGGPNCGSWWYECLFPAMIAGWRAAFEAPALPFFYVLLAAGHTSLLREAQVAGAARLPHTAFASALDLGATDAEMARGFEPGHPIRKQEVGRRLAVNARALLYGEAAALGALREGPVVAGYALSYGAAAAAAAAAAPLTVTLRFDAASAAGQLHLAGTAPCCAPPNTTAAACAACWACCTGARGSPVTFSDPDAGSLLAPASKVFASAVHLDAAAATLTASLPTGSSFTSSKGRVQIEFLFENAPLCGVYNGVGGANEHAGIVATPWRVNATLPAQRGPRRVTATATATAAAAAVFDVEAYGAKTGNASNTVAFRAAIAAAAAAVAAAGDASTRATILVRGPGVYLTGAFNLSTRLTLDVRRGATVKGITVAASPSSAAAGGPGSLGFEFPVIDFLPSYGSNRDTHTGTFRHQALLMVPFADGAKVVGGGALDGSGAWWAAQRNAGALTAGRPHLLEIFNSTDTELADVTLANSAFWTLHPVYSRGVHVHGVTIDSACDSENTDGIDPDSSSDVLIENVTIASGDDHIAIKSGMDGAGLAFGMPSTNVTVRNATFLCGRGISIGSEVSGGVSGVLVEDVALLGPSKHGIHLKTSATRGGYIRDVLYRRIAIGDVVGDAVLGILTSYDDQEAAGGASRATRATSAADAPPLTDIRNIRWENITRGGPHIADKGAGAFNCFADQPCANVTLYGVHLDPARGWACSHVSSPDAPGRKAVVDVSPSGLSTCLHN